MVYTPVNKDYLYFYYYQYFSNWPSSINSKYSIRLPGSSKTEIPTLQKLAKVIHRHHAMSIPVYNNKFSEATERFLDLTGVNIIAAEKKVNFLDEDYKIVQNFPEINIWSRKSKFEPIRIACNVFLENKKKQIYESLLFDNHFDIKNTIISENRVKFLKCDKESKIVNYNFGYKDGIKINIQNPSGILVTNIVFNQNLEAKSNYVKLKTFKCNGAFTCVILNKDNSKIILNYTNASVSKK